MRTAHRIHRLVLAFGLAALALAGCGDRRMTLGVDALSFTSPAERVVAFGPVPALPVPVQTGEVPVFDDLHVNLIDGTKQVVDVESATIAFTADVADSTGDGLDTLRVYLSGPDTDPVTTAPVVTVPVTLVPGQHAPVHVVIDGDARVDALFMQPVVRLTLTTALRGPASGAPLVGTLTVTQLRADVVARHHAL